LKKNKKGIQAPILKRDVTSKPEIKITMEDPASAEDLIDRKLQNEKIKREEEIKRKGEHAVQKKLQEENREKEEREKLERLKEEFKQKINLKEDAYSKDPPTEKSHKETYKNGNVYTGGWKDGQPHGHGVMKWKNGDSYDGEWKNGKKKWIWSLCF